ncbi:MAG TPA: chorismate synthase [Vicinamibacteria bacterium]|nr:chorismate synthase [Vicinamibacteria bacterium]
MSQERSGGIVRRLRFLTAGESHGPALTVIVEGLPAGVTVDRAAIDADLRRRQGGYGRGGRMKIESDSVEVLSGVRHGATLGSPVTLVIRNRDHANWADVMSPDPQPAAAKQRRALKHPRPGHADLAGAIKYLTDDLRDVLERASARETTARVAAGGLAKSLLAAAGIEVRSHVVRIGKAAVAAETAPWDALAAAEPSPVRCVEEKAAAAMIAEIDAAKKAGDTVGGVFEVVARGVPPGLGSFAHWDRRLDGRLAQALMSIQAVKAVALGEGFRGGETPGSSFHDEILFDDARGLSRPSNRAGGLEGGVTNGEELRARAVVKPIPTLLMPLRSIDMRTKEPQMASVERSDTCVVPAAGVVGEAMVAWVLADALVEKLGGDSLTEMLAHLEATRRLGDQFLSRRG